MQTKPNIRVLHVLPELKEGGVERGVIEKVIWLKEHGVEAVVVSAGGMWLSKLKNAGIRHFELPVHKKNPFTIFSCSIKLSKIITDEKIQLVCAHSRVPAWIADIATSRGHAHNPPLVTVAEALYERFWYSKVMCRGDRIIAVSGTIRDHMISLGCDKSKIKVIPPGIAPSDFPAESNEAGGKIRAEWGIPDDAKLVLGVGRITGLKGWDILIKAVSLLPDSKLYCVIVGSAHHRKKKYLDELLSLASNLGLSDHVKFVGHRDDMAAIYSAADCVVMPSRIVEAFGRVVIEGILSGKPVISTIGCGVAEFLGEEYRDFLIPMNDEKSLAEKIKMVFENPDAVKGKVKIIGEKIGRELTLDRSMWATVQVYRELCPELDWPKERRE
jgi:glycosyltransferase involved in cell wall biosynthesis